VHRLAGRRGQLGETFTETAEPKLGEQFRQLLMIDAADAAGFPIRFDRDMSVETNKLPRQ
jgi:hypothetical protein